jgi:uncharacterized protein (DUF1778 family)
VKGDPVDPVTFSVAARELFERTAEHRGIDLTSFRRATDDELPDEAQVERKQVDETLGRIRSEAGFKLDGLMLVEELRSWTRKDGEWKRVAQDELKQFVMSAFDERAVLYLDREELFRLSPDKFTLDRVTKQNSPELVNIGEARKPGRPKGTRKYEQADEPFLIEMRRKLKSGEECSLNAAAMAVAEPAAGGGTTESKARRLRDAYVRRWGHGA